MNFSEAQMREQAQKLAPTPWLVTEEDHRIQRKRERRLLIAEADEHVMAVWHERFPEDVAAKNKFWEQRRAVRAAERTNRRERKALAEAQCELAVASTWDDNDPRWEDAFLSSDYTTEEDENEE
ncbi:uncharacterized protein [Aegilops tauschii subsp. strangulata]|uniref:uncharacterized protein n=1 Tax=Aegilops tauschii subsp. strangulata TaxID=200361 RepID=UPI00098A3528|nr:uncharacterized protein LOC109738230 [Aegilops tauschii subsp. strangulata]